MIFNVENKFVKLNVFVVTVLLFLILLSPIKVNAANQSGTGGGRIHSNAKR